MFANKRIMIVVAHPDDELLGVGATMHRLIKTQNVETHVVILGEGLTSRGDVKDSKSWERQLSIHHTNVKMAQQIIGYHSLSMLNLPDNRFDTVALLDIIKIVEKEKSIFRPQIIFTHHGGDLNIDHRRTFEAVITACRPMAQEEVRTLFTFETPSGTEWRASNDPYHFVPNYFVGVEESDLEAKILGMESYEFEKREFPHPRSPEALRTQALRWGVCIGRKYAEAFNIVRSIL